MNSFNYRNVSCVKIIFLIIEDQVIIGTYTSGSILFPIRETKKTIKTFESRSKEIIMHDFGKKSIIYFSLKRLRCSVLLK